MLSLTLVGILVPLLLVAVGLTVLIAVLHAFGMVLGLLWPLLPIAIGLALIGRLVRGHRR